MRFAKMIVTAIVSVLTFFALTWWMTSELGLSAYWASMIGAACAFGEVILSIKIHI